MIIDLSDDAVAWLKEGEPCLAALQLAEWITGMPLVNRHYPTRKNPHSFPLTGQDFWRCCKMFDAVPEWATHIEAKCTKHKAWALLVASWDEVADVLTYEINANELLAPRTTGRLLEIFRLAA